MVVHGIGQVVGAHEMVVEAPEALHRLELAQLLDALLVALLRVGSIGRLRL